MHYRLLLIDVDNTLVEYGDDRIGPSALDALHRAQQAGCVVVICTGRTVYRAREIAAQIGGHGYAVCLNGAVIVDWETGEVLQRTPLDLDTARNAIRIAQDLGFAPLCFGVELDDRAVHTDRQHPLLRQYEIDHAHRLTYYADLAADLPGPPVCIETYGPHARTEALVAAWHSGLVGGVSAFEWGATRYGCMGAHMHGPNIDKARGAMVVAARLDIPREQSLALGDEVNDIELLQWAGMGVAMGNGHPKARAAADFVTGAVHEDGVAQAIDRFVLSGGLPGLAAIDVAGFPRARE